MQFRNIVERTNLLGERIFTPKGNMKLPSQDSAVGRGIKTAIQSIIGFVAGLVIVVWNVPGVSEAIIQYTQTHLLEVLLSMGIPVAISSGVVSYIWNLFRKDVKNY